MKRLLYILGTSVAACAMAPSAHAVTYTQINLAPVGGVLTSNYGASALDAGNFSHDFTFSLPSMGGLTSSLITIALDGIGQAGDINFSGASLWQGGSIVSNFNLSANGFTEVGELILNNVTSGDYMLRIEGSAVGGGSYSGTVNFSPSAIPEPATWAMMMLGMGGLAFAMRRRKQSLTPNSVRVNFA